MQHSSDMNSTRNSCVLKVLGLGLVRVRVLSVAACLTAWLGNHHRLELWLALHSSDMGVANVAITYLSNVVYTYLCNVVYVSCVITRHCTAVT